MILSKVVSHLRQYCPTVDRRVAVALDFEPSNGQIAFKVPALVVLASGDDANPPESQNVDAQVITDRFTVVMILATSDPKRGDDTADVIHKLRAEIWRALIGWAPDNNYERIIYDGGDVISMDRSATYYGLDFSADFVVGNYSLAKDAAQATAETWQEYELLGLPELAGFDVDVDVIDPIADRNVQKPGPDGRIEFKLRENVND